MSAAILVSTPQKVALLDVKKSLEAFQKLSIPVLGLIENMSYFICHKCGDKHEIFGKNKIQDFLNENSISLIGRIPINPSIAFGDDDKDSIVENSEENISNDVFDKIAKSIDAQIKKNLKPQIKSMFILILLFFSNKIFSLRSSISLKL
ncbi:MAG: hypothetical protein Ct9H300mP6_19450 [Gammaproteobacteria bacterium]|nr:MAG: hypothetical protein Ct9H300mP6_19450 [Gammaproteobacteria bacterium]